MSEPVKYTFPGYCRGIVMKIPRLIVFSSKDFFGIINCFLVLITAFNKQISEFLRLHWQGISPKWSAIFIISLTLRAIVRAMYDDREEIYLSYKEVEERTIKAEEKLITKIIIYLKDCILNSDGYLYMKLSLCNDGYKQWTIETVNIITADKNHLLKIQNPNICIDNNYNNILNIECISSISQEDTSEFDIPFNPDDTKVITIKKLFNVKEYLKDKNIDKIKKMPLGIMMRVRDYKGLQYFVDYYPCCELNIGEDNKIRTYIIHKPFEKILKEGETSIVKSWRLC